MSAVRLPLLYAFVGGCLTNAALFGVWRAVERSGDATAKQQHQPRDVAELIASAAPSTEQAREPLAVNAVQPVRDAVPVTGVQAASDPESDNPAPAGSPVSDVLARLETAYRERAAARAPSEAPASPPALALAPVEPPPVAPAQPPDPVAQAAPVVAAAPIAAAPLAPVPIAAAPLAPVAAAPAALEPQVAAGPPFGAPEPPPPTQIHYGDVNQNTYITNVRQGDVYLIQMQQLAMLQYMQMLGMSGNAAAPARHVGAAVHQRSTPFPSGITNPDNPWGFHFSPPNLVR